MLDATADLFQEYDKSTKEFYSCLVTGSFAFLLFIFLILFERLMKKSKFILKNSKLFLFLSEMNLLLAYLSITAVWRTYWNVIFKRFFVTLYSNEFILIFKF